MRPPSAAARQQLDKFDSSVLRQLTQLRRDPAEDWVAFHWRHHQAAVRLRKKFDAPSSLAKAARAVPSWCGHVARRPNSLASRVHRSRGTFRWSIVHAGGGSAGRPLPSLVAALDPVTGFGSFGVCGSRVGFCRCARDAWRAPAGAVHHFCNESLGRLRGAGFAAIPLSRDGGVPLATESNWCTMYAYPLAMQALRLTTAVHESVPAAMTRTTSSAPRFWA